MEKKINKGKLKKYVASGLLLTAIITGTGIMIEKNTEHLYETCPLCYIIGMKHQANYINKNWNDKWVAVYVPKDDIPEGYVKVTEGKGIKKTGAFMKYSEGKTYAILYDENGNIIDRIEITDYSRVDIYNKRSYDYYNGDLEDYMLEPVTTLSKHSGR